MAQMSIGKSLPMLLMSLAVAAAMPQSAERTAPAAANQGAQQLAASPRADAGAPEAAVVPASDRYVAESQWSGSAPEDDRSYDEGAPADGADNAAPPSNAPAPRMDAQRLSDLVAPIALYPDDLVAIILPASTYPLQVVEAERFLEHQKQEPDAMPDKEWDDSIVALLNYPDVVSMMDRDLDWTSDLGQAVMTDQAQVLDAIGQFRSRAKVAGNLASDDHQIVEEDRGQIEIRPANPQEMYVPYYEPAQVTVYQSEPVIFYYPVAFPVYYYPYPRDYRFHSPYFWGVSSAYRIGWWSRCVHVYPYYNAGHPYYGHPYGGYYYRPPPSYRDHSDGRDWQRDQSAFVAPAPHHDAMPAAQALDRIDDTVWRPAKTQRTSAQLGRVTHGHAAPASAHGDADTNGETASFGDDSNRHPTVKLRDTSRDAEDASTESPMLHAHGDRNGMRTARDDDAQSNAGSTSRDDGNDTHSSRHSERVGTTAAQPQPQPAREPTPQQSGEARQQAQRFAPPHDNGAHSQGQGSQQQGQGAEQGGGHPPRQSQSPKAATPPAQDGRVSDHQ